MKIGVNARFLIEGRLEGIGWFCHEVISRMVRQYPQHEFYLFFDRPFSQKFIFSNNVHGVVLNPPARHPVLWYWWFERSIPAALKKFKCDVFLSMDGFGSLSLEIPQHIVIHDLAYLHFPQHIKWLHEKYYRYFIPKFLHKADFIYTISKATKEDVVNNLKVDSEKIEICYNGCKEMFVPLSKEEISEVRNKYTNSCPYFLFVGALHPRKNVHGLIKAFDEFKKTDLQNFKLVIVGRKAWLTGIIEEAYQSAIYKGHIIFLEDLDNAQLAKVTGSAFAAISPSFLEGFGVPVLEALYCDVPVLCSNTFSLPEISGPGAILFDPQNIQSITDAIKKISSENNFTSRIELGRIHRAQFTWDKTAQIICNGIFT
ncbi:MAG: glycosyltransferase family 4 protein [Saprospiraceae bacterium]|nr:glycosyltransferase family 4 protein [Saprospiraceae bacterium]